MDAKDLAYAAARGGTPPTGLENAIKALWLARAGRWDAAHDLCKKDETDVKASWVHAHLHRVKGDFDNAGHWYDLAGKPKLNGQSKLAEEWFEIAEELLAKR